jgi:2-keto-3-deoxy-L-rhamnonate aldolase RhmA
MFDTTRQSFRERLRAGPSVGMMWLTMGSLPMVEMAARAGADAIGLDAQHGLWDRLGIEHAIGAAAGAIPVLVRVAQNGAVPIGQALDAGAEGVIVPLVETAAQAAHAVACAHFPPRGIRSGGGVRPLTYGFAAYCAAANDRVTVGVMIETAAGVAEAEAIARTTGVDFVFIGTGDLALSLGCFPVPDARHEDACRRILAACRAAQVPCGIYTATVEAARARRDQGFALVTLATDTDMVAHGFKEAVSRYGTADQTPAAAPDRRIPMARGRRR